MPGQQALAVDQTGLSHWVISLGYLTGLSHWAISPGYLIRLSHRSGERMLGYRYIDVAEHHCAMRILIMTGIKIVS